MNSPQYKNGDYKEYFRYDSKLVFGFFEQYRYLSNFHLCKVMWDGVEWPSSEHAYMAAKCANTSFNVFGEKIYSANTNRQLAEASCSFIKKWGQEVVLRPDWEDVKVEIMTSILYSKFLENEELRERLVATGERKLIEANSWGDAYWGYDVRRDCGMNMLGEILMTVRSQLS